MGKITPLFGDQEGEPAKESPEPILTGLIAEMTTQLIAAKNQVSEARNEERRLAKQAEVAARAVGEWEQRAMAAVRAGDDVVARDALLRKQQQELECERFRAAGQAQHERVAASTRALVTLNLRVEEAKHKRNAVVVRAEQADVGAALEKEAADAAEADLTEMLKRLEAKMSDIETELELSDDAIANLAREAGDALRIQEEFTRMKRDTSDPALLASKPLAKTGPSEGESTRPSTAQAVGIFGPQRTKR